ncbi:MAG: hypothetical protein GY757_09720 [bacterium]|nr:hypothetical protein [bacterium]
MKNTYNPEVIYDVFGRIGFPVLRIDQFDRGNYAEIRAELKYPKFITVTQLQQIAMKLAIIEKNENIRIEISNIDMLHRTLRVNIHTLDDPGPI